MHANLSGKVAIVTGGYTVLGMTVCRGLAEAGADIGIIARTREKIEAVIPEIQALGVRAIPLVADITDESQVIKAFEQARRDLGRIDVMVNNTGLPGALMSVADMQLSEWEKILATNLTGTMLCCRESVRHMRPQGGGAIVNVGSSGGKRGVPHSAAYTASKFGMIGLTQTLAQEVGRYNIRANCIALGAVEGPRTDWQIKRKSEAAGISGDEERQRREAGTSLGRLPSQAEFAQLTVFLASDLSSGMTGQAINLTAGSIFH
ncbi:SDR family oxidoreductase [Dehalococcoidia bacterium]|nr:SDR family oxidoreductase [Dehalococcoidia bacterium]